MTHKNIRHIFLLLGILAIGATFRFYNLNWDQDQHLHPDERFLTMVGNAMQMPKNFTEYLDPKTSLLNPPNIGFSFFVYGILPITLNKVLATEMNNDTYTAFTLQGRFLSALADLLIIIIVFLITRLLEKKYGLSQSIKYIASFLYASFTLPIQLSHYFAVDTFLSLFLLASFYFSLRFTFAKNFGNMLLSAICFGLALSCKVSAVFMLPLLLFLLLGIHTYNRQAIKMLLRKKQLFSICSAVLLFGTVSYFTLRLFDPYMFENTNLFDPTINKIFLANLQSLKSFEQGDVWFPPAIQWIDKPPIIFSLGNLAVLGVGIPSFVFLLYGIYIIFRQHRHTLLFIMLLWTLCFFLYQSTQFVKAMRYFIFIYPFLAIFAAIGFSAMTKKANRIVKSVLLLLVLIPPLMFLSVYVLPTTRIAASHWIYENLPTNSTLLTEHWDDPLPLLLTKNHGKTFQGPQLPVFAQDDEDKWQQMDVLLEQGDYYILSSNRGWGSIQSVPDKYPRMQKFYNDLFAGKLAYKKIAEFSSYPSLSYLGIPITLPDDWADESFTVYDHPKVLIFKKTITPSSVQQ